MKGKIFSRRMALVYTMIVAVPLSVLILAGSEYLKELEYRRIITAAENDLKDNTAHVVLCLDLFIRIESAVSGNRGIDDLFLFTDTSDKLSVVFRLWDIYGELERLRACLPLSCGIHIFVDDPTIPERWPILFHQKRLLHAGTRDMPWRYGEAGELVNISIMDGERVVSYTTEFLLHKRRVGDLQITMNMTDFFPFIFRDAGTRQYFAISDSGFICSSGGTELSKTVVEQLFQAAAGKETGVLNFRDNAASRCLIWRSVPNSELLLVRDLSGELAGAGIAAFRIAAGIGIVFSIALLFAVIRFATGRMMRRLYSIQNSMGELRRGNLDVSVKEDGNDELSDMAQAFNNMVRRIRKLIAQITEEQRLVTETEIHAMQNQINAHFFYNALETIRMQAELRDENPIVNSITLLGKMLRYCLRFRGNRVTIREELEYIYSYISFLNIRNDYIITLKESIDKGILDCLIPKMLIQPVVENAFLHAIEPEGEDAVIELTVEKEGTALWVSVRDYGPGFSATESADPTTKRKDSGIGLSNIQMRLSAFYGPVWKLRIESPPGGGTLVRIPVPEALE